MSGHSKWANIKRRKGTEDAKKGKLFTRLGKDIMVATKTGGADPDSNSSLRTAVEKARANNMPKDKIQHSIDRGAGKVAGVEIIEAVYEGYGPGGVAFLINCLTDNKNRIVSELRNIFNKHGGTLADAGSVSYIFEQNKTPVFTIPLDADKLEVFDSLMDDLEELDDVVDIFHNKSA